MIERIALDDTTGLAAFLAAHPRAIVLFRGQGCPYSATFEPVFVALTPEPAVVRLVEEGGRGPVAAALGVDITPTVARFDRGREVARLNGRLLLGITRTGYGRWLKQSSHTG